MRSSPSAISKFRVRSGALVAGALLGATSLEAQVSVDTTVTPLAGTFRYDISVSNNALEDLAIVSITDAPLNDPFIGITLTTPVGFLGSYDSGLGFVDLLADTASFSVGATVGGFSFESLSGPASFFTQFEALGVTGNSFPGTLNVTIVPESGTVGAAGALLLLILSFRFRHKLCHN